MSKLQPSTSTSSSSAGDETSTSGHGPPLNAYESIKALIPQINILNIVVCLRNGCIGFGYLIGR